MRIHRLFQRSFIFGIALSCSLSTVAAATTAANDLRLDWLDHSANPSKNFFAYANGSWQKQNPIPRAYGRWGTLHILQEKNLAIIHHIMQTLAESKTNKTGSIEQKVGDFYFSGMDEASINKAGVTPIQSEFDKINQINNVTDLQHAIAHLHMIGVDAVFGLGEMQDFKNSNQVIAAASQDGLGLPDRDYYLKQDAHFKKIRQLYVQHIAKIFQLLGDTPKQSAAEAKTVMSIETALAKASMPLVEQRNPNAIYHMYTIAQLNQATPNFSWQLYLKDIGHPEINHLNLATPDFFKTVNSKLKTTSIADWKTYLRWHLIGNFGSYLSTPFVNENFHMASQLTGAKELLPRWKRVAATEDGALGFAIGKLYIEKTFSPAAKKAALEITNNIRAAMRDDLQHLDWMSPETRSAALKKLSLMGERIGYPNKWRDYSKLTINRGPYVLNVIRTNIFLYQRELNKIGKPVDRSEWDMTPQTVNAYYDPSMNNLNIPAGILQPPLFSASASPAVNYGGIGTVIGHEMTHGFDDEGAQFDGNGNLQNWWQAIDLAKFKKATQCIADQYSHYTVSGNQHVKGQLVVGEASADLGGVTLAYRAMHATKNFNKEKTIQGFTPDQQFFLSFAHIWAMNITPQDAQRLVVVDPHPPAIYRVNGTLKNFTPFQVAFYEPLHSTTNKTCKIW